MESEDHNIHVRVASFSAYLNTAEENLKFRLGGTTSEDSSSATISLTKSADSEVNIFGTDNYFKMKLDFKAHTLSDQANPNRRTNSSHSSQSALLERNPSQIMHKKSHGRWFFHGICSGTCLNKKSVSISSGNKQSESSGSQKGDHFAFPILNSGVEEEKEKKKKEEEPRKSLEVFGSSCMGGKGEIAMNLERKLSMLTWDAIPKSPNVPANWGTTYDQVDNTSEASSDLFEIENIAAGTGQYSFLARHASENMSTCMSPTTTTTQYAPSEASIEWSIVTGSVADFSFASEYDEKSVVSGAAKRTIAGKGKRMSIGKSEMETMVERY